MPQKASYATRKRLRVGIAILAGGLSTRMGQDKAGVRLGRRTLLGHVRATAKLLRLPTRIIRRDIVPRCGPLGGIYTALKTSRAHAELFLSCDMPFVSEKFLRDLVRRSRSGQRPTFALTDEGAGFPMILPVDCASVIQVRIEAQDLSIQSLADALAALRVNGSGRELMNINTPGDLAAAQGRSGEQARALGRKGSRPVRCAVCL